MDPRIDFGKLSPAPYKALSGLEVYLHKCSIELPMLHMIKLRASQVNGCAFCIDMHWKDARAAGESEQRLYGLDAWRESPYYTDRERAALAWTEAVTLVTEGHAPDELFNEVRKHFSEAEVVDLTWAIAAINAWNRMNIALRTVPGAYRPGQFHL